MHMEKSCHCFQFKRKKNMQRKLKLIRRGGNEHTVTRIKNPPQPAPHTGTYFTF